MAADQGIPGLSPDRYDIGACSLKYGLKSQNLAVKVKVKVLVTYPPQISFVFYIQPPVILFQIKIIHKLDQFNPDSNPD